MSEKNIFFPGNIAGETKTHLHSQVSCSMLYQIISWMFLYIAKHSLSITGGWSGGAKVLGKLSVPGRPTSLDDSRARAYCACSRCGWGLFGHFSLIYLFSFLSSSLWETARYGLKYCLKGPLNPKQPTNQIVYNSKNIIQIKHNLNNIFAVNNV